VPQSYRLAVRTPTIRRRRAGFDATAEVRRIAAGRALDPVDRQAWQVIRLAQRHRADQRVQVADSALRLGVHRYAAQAIRARAGGLQVDPKLSTEPVLAAERQLIGDATGMAPPPHPGCCSTRLLTGSTCHTRSAPR
jgi:hypothetical protein